MQVPEEWEQRKRAPNANSAADLLPKSKFSSGSGGSGGGSSGGRVGLQPSELHTFAAAAQSQHVSITSQFLRSMGNDAGSICKRILSLLPDHDPDRVTGKRKAPGSDDGADSRDQEDGIQQESENKPQRCDMRLELDTLLSRLPYKRMMQEMMPHNLEHPVPSVPYVSRVYEERFMREPVGANERLCVMGQECECMFLDKSHPFVGVEFVLPGEENTGMDAETPQMCVLCSRAMATELFYDMVFENASLSGLIQRYGNLHGVPNEYAKSAMLICPANGPLHCMPAPIVRHERNQYSVCKVGGVTYLRQHGVYFQ